MGEHGASAFAKNRAGCSARDIALTRWRPKIPGENAPWEAEDDPDPALTQRQTRRGVELLQAFNTRPQQRSTREKPSKTSRSGPSSSAGRKKQLPSSYARSVILENLADS